MQEISWSVAGQAYLIALQAVIFFAFIGYWPARILCRGAWGAYLLALAPFVGWLLAVTVSYYLNALLLNMVQVFWVLAVLGVVGNVAVFALRRVESPQQPSRWLIGAALAGLVLFTVAVLPHAKADSLGLLGLNVDEELYYPYAEHIKHYPATMRGSADGPYLDLFSTTNFKARGQGFAYMLSLTSTLTRTPTFLAYMPLVYTMLGLSVVSVFIFARAGLRLSPATSFLAAGLYALNGLPLWFSSMGFGPHTVAFALFPVALAALMVAVRDGGKGAVFLAGWTSAVLVSSYFWAISAVFLVSAAPLLLVLALARPSRLNSLRRIAGAGLVGMVTGFPGLFWLARWAFPQLRAITGNLNASFGNAWGDLTFPAFKTSLGLQAYHMADDPAGMAELLGGRVAGALIRLQEPVWLVFLALALIAIIRMHGDRLAAGLLAVSFGGFMYWVWQVAGYQYGHFKNLSYVSFFGDTLLAAGLGVLWSAGAAGRRGGRAHGYVRRLGKWPARSAAALTLVAIVALTARNTLQTARWYWVGFSWNMPAAAVDDARRIARILPKGASVKLSEHAKYPLVAGSVSFRPFSLAFHFESDAIDRWTKRLAAILAAELAGRNFYAPEGTTVFPPNVPSDLPAPDYLILGRLEDPRLHGFLRQENLLQGGQVGLFPNRERLILDGSELAQAFGGSNFFGPEGPLILSVGPEELRSGPLAAAGPPGPPRQMLLGLVNTAGHNVGLEVEAGSKTAFHSLNPGLNWAVLEPTATPFELRLRPAEADTVQVFLAREFDPALGIPAGLSSDPSSVISVRVSVQGESIRAVLGFINPGQKGANVGVTYREDATQGFWVSAAARSAKAQGIQLDYSVPARELVESVNGQPIKTSVARDAESGGVRSFEIAFAHGEETDFRFVLFKYQWQPGTAEIVWQPFTPYVFNLVDR